MEKKEINKKEVAAVTAKGESLTVKVGKLNWKHKIRLVPKEQTFVIKPVCAGNLMRISELLLDIDIDLESESGWKDGLKTLAKHTPAIIEMLAIAIHNERTEPPKKLVEYLFANTDTNTMMAGLLTVIKQLNVTSFTITIALLKKVSLMNPGS
jgi:hypothetical protein